MRNRFRAVITVIVVTAMLVTSAAYAHEIPTASAAKGNTLVDPTPYLVESIRATQHSTDLDYATATAARYTDGSVIVRIPGLNFGGAAVRFVDDQLASVMVMTNTVVAGIASSDVSVDGRPIAHLVLDETTGQIQSGWVMQGDTQVDATDVQANVNWSCWAGCMSNIMGVPNWVISTIMAICGLACVGSAGVGCVVCAQAAVILYGSEASFCFGWCRGR